MKKISDILKEIEERKREEIVGTFNCHMEAISCEDVKWEEFIVYPRSEQVMKNILLSMETYYIMVICDHVKTIREKENEEDRTVKICITEGKEDCIKNKEIWTIKENLNTLLAVISVSNKEKNYLQKKAER